MYTNIAADRSIHRQDCCRQHEGGSQGICRDCRRKEENQDVALQALASCRGSFAGWGRSCSWTVEAALRRARFASVTLVRHSMVGLTRSLGLGPASAHFTVVVNTLPRVHVWGTAYEKLHCTSLDDALCTHVSTKRLLGFLGSHRTHASIHDEPSPPPPPPVAIDVTRRLPDALVRSPWIPTTHPPTHPLSCLQ